MRRASLWALLAIAIYALAVLTVFDTQWAPLDTGTVPVLAVMTAIGFGAAVRSWWAPLGALALPVVQLMLDPDVIGDGLSASGIGVDQERTGSGLDFEHMWLEKQVLECKT